MTTLRLATRKSKLALAQARAYYRGLQAQHDGLTVDEVHIVTSGDKFVDRPLQALGGKGLFIKEIEEALLDGRADIAVHSIKDVPAELAPKLALASIPEREDPRDVIVTREGGKLADLPKGARVGTSSLRRKCMLLRSRPDLDIGPLRGNVDTRLRKLEEGQVDAIVLAYAGLRRLDIADRATEILEPETMLPAVGQGALGIECREEDDAVRAVLATSDHAETRVRVAGERAFMAAVGGSCQLPVAAFALHEGDQLWLRAMVADPDGSNPRYGERRTSWPADFAEAEREAERAGVDLGRELR
ncbi:MAG: hydroxymethylbilane synthase [Polyangiaceae bacterium]